MANQKCQQCRYRWFKESIDRGAAIHYAGEVPCTTCDHNTKTTDRFEPDNMMSNFDNKLK